jgi:hypothetical protein
MDWQILIEINEETKWAVISPHLFFTDYIENKAV